MTPFARQNLNPEAIRPNSSDELSDLFSRTTWPGASSSFQKFHRVIMNADYWEKRTALIGDGAVRVLSLFRPEEVDYWRDELKSHRRNSREIELMTWATNEATLRGRAHYGRIDEFAEYVFQFIRTSEGELWKFGAVAFSKAEDRALARQVIDIFGTKN
jgi:hypothetical protein